MSNENKHTVQGVRDFYTNTSEYNQLRFVIEQIIRETVNTSAIVRIDSVTGTGADSPAGTVSATPLVAQIDARGDAIPMASIPKLKMFRHQAGKAAIILDPVPGDQALAVYNKFDSSNVLPGTSEPQRPGSLRQYDQSDGVAIVGTQNQTPTVWIELKQDETIVIHAPAGVTVETDAGCVINAGQKFEVNAPVINLNGTLTSSGYGGGAGTATVNGSLNATSDVTASDVSLLSHVHGGVQTGSGNTGAPS